MTVYTHRIEFVYYGIVKQAMKRHYKFDKDLFMTFVDYNQVYDCKNRENFWKVVINFEIPKKFVNMIKLCNTETVFEVEFLGELLSESEVNSEL